MGLIVEIIGAPASGKTFFYDYLKKFSCEGKSNSFCTKSYKKNFFDFYFQRKNNSIRFKKLIYSYYIKKFQVKSNILFKNEYNDLNKFIKQKLSEDKKYKKIFKLYKKYISTTKYTNERKNRAIKNFEIDFLGSKYNDKNKQFEIFDEGFLQKIFVNFQGNNNLKFNNKNQIEYLKLVPNPDVVLLFKTNIKICLERAKKRKDGFLYKADKLRYVSSKDYFCKNVLKYIVKQKIPIIELDGTKDCKKNMQLFLENFKIINKSYK